MILSSKGCAGILAAGALSLGICAIMPAAQAGSIVSDPQAVAAASTVTKAQAEALALTTVGGGTVILAVLEKEDSGLVHWSIDIRGTTHEYEVWVRLSLPAKVLKIITQPL